MELWYSYLTGVAEKSSGVGGIHIFEDDGCGCHGCSCLGSKI
jgi:hypothetical protein